MKYIYILISSALVIYLIMLTLIYVNQRKLLYLTSENNYLDDPINFNYKELFIEVDKNIKLKPPIVNLQKRSLALRAKNKHLNKINKIIHRIQNSKIHNINSILNLFDNLNFVV